MTMLNTVSSNYKPVPATLYVCINAYIYVQFASALCVAKCVLWATIVCLIFLQLMSLRGLDSQELQ